MNLPNKLSLMRMALVPLLVVVYLFPYTEVISYEIQGVSVTLPSIICFIIFVVASITDFLDGYIARKYKMITSFGKFIDPIADKLLVNSCFLLLAFSNEIPFVLVWIMICRDSIVDAIRMMASTKGIVMAATMSGKVKTVVQMLAIMVCFLNNVPFARVGIPVDIILVYCACLVSVISGVSYFIQAKEVVLESM